MRGAAPVRSPMDFFEAQDHARAASRRWVALYVAAVVALIVGVYLAVAAVLGFVPLFSDGPVLDQKLFHPELFGAVALAMGFLIGGGTLFRTAQLRRGGPAVARLLGGRPVDPTTPDPLERRLLNVVEEMAIASGLPVPAVFVLDAEKGINAFAAGHTVHDAAVAVTRGLLENLNRDELQGVVAHEFSHILNGDMRLNVRLMGLLFGIFLLTVVGRGLMRGAVRERRTARSYSRVQVQGGGQIALLGLALVVLGYIGVLVGRLIQAAVSRQREFLADAAAVEFTRNPAGLAGALKKIAAWAYGSRLANHHAEEASHLFFAPGLGGALAGLVATHPPLEERIRRLDPHWDGRLEAAPGASGPATRRGPGRADPPRKKGSAPLDLDPAPPPAALPLAAAAGTLDPRHLARARSLLDELPAELKEAVRSPHGALAVVLALLGGEAGGEGGAPAPASVARLAPHLRLPLLELAAASLRDLPAPEKRALPARLAALIRADGQILPFEFAAYHLVRRALEAGEEAGRAAPLAGRIPLGRLADEVSVLLSALAWAGGGGGQGADPAAALAAGARTLGIPVRLLPPASVTLDRVDAALDRLTATSFEARRRVLEAASAVVFFDGRAEAAEVELWRAVAAALGVPLPPWIPSASSGP